MERMLAVSLVILFCCFSKVLFLATFTNWLWNMFDVIAKLNVSIAKNVAVFLADFSFAHKLGRRVGGGGEIFSITTTTSRAALDETRQKKVAKTFFCWYLFFLFVKCNKTRRRTICCSSASCYSYREGGVCLSHRLPCQLRTTIITIMGDPAAKQAC